MTSTDRLPLDRPTRDRTELRGVLGRFATGVTVVTAGRAEPRGMTANSFTSVSLDPAVILVCVLRTAAVHETILAERAFAVSVLAGPQEKAARHFADRHRPRGALEFDAVETTPGRHTGAPVLVGAQAWLECELTAEYDGGDHSIFLGSVVDLGRSVADDPLLYFAGGFHRLVD
ncbi:flavin reductase (DIM6/NTAB) family NADH-FMN oxidoreductase RutF [Kitasatospora gansuensis]|uniref:Flavin reductase (DIM6/NTAB) family NADH-FMN oxidoreductase RutF n=1 Tax=Kitasatospora gansuensis TaxID=258050 RepID=A0A7W7WLU7_9ACTN|nr:flavin reductase family protein [Kitasatospora gansuensis]MBB4951465.1 flavin reductase (DIM6/NTAB) family NADH-FMN oxidoreductase RutF [Kitasatospora gansuensis]